MLRTIMPVKRLIYLLLVVLIAFTVPAYLPHSQSYWFIWSLLAFAELQGGVTFMRRIKLQYTTGIATAVAVFFAGCFAAVTVLLALLLGFITLCCALLSEKRPQYFFPIFLMNLFAILSGLLMPTMLENFARTADILAAITIIMLLQLLFSPQFVRHEIRYLLQFALRNLNNLNKDIFACFLQPEYPDNIYLFEKRLHVQKTKWLQTLMRLRAIAHVNHSDKRLPSLIDKLDKCYETLLAAAQLRLRVKDHTTFSLCTEELKSVLLSMEQILLTLAQMATDAKKTLSLVQADAAIKALEANYHHVLLVAARQPLVFLLFIASLKAFLEESVHLAKAITATINQGKHHEAST